MSDNKQQPGSIGWRDLTVPNAGEVKEFYRAVVGWQPSGVEMGDYEDYNMNHPVTGAPIAGICHARGVNEGLPPVWMIYILVADLEASAAKATELGGKLLRPPKDLGGQGAYAIIEDPAGAVCALYQPAG